MYPKLNQTQVDNFDVWGKFNEGIATILQKFSTNLVSPLLTGGSTGTTVTEYFFVAPDDIRVTGMKVLVDTPNTGSSNTPDVNINNGATKVATAAAIAVTHSAGDVVTGTLNATDANLLVPKGTVLTITVVTPSSTVSTALKAKVIMEYNTTAELQ